MPLVLTTDKGTESTYKFAATLCKPIGIEHTRSTSYCPQTGGQTERMSQVLDGMLRHHITPKTDNWDEMCHWHNSSHLSHAPVVGGH